MSQVFDTILKNATIVSHNKKEKFDIGLYHGSIKAIGNLFQSTASKIINCKGLHIIPGIIDSQVHFREPGFEYKEDLESGSIAAVLGGVTTVFDMPNTYPLTISAETLNEKIKKAHHRMYCDFAFWIGATHANIQELRELEQLSGAAGIKVFMGSSTGNLLVEDDKEIRFILQNTRKRTAFHSEDEKRLKQRKHLRIKDDVSSHPNWRDNISALKATKRLLKIARETNARIHILHISTKEEIAFLKKHKDIATIEVTPHHLTLTNKDYLHLKTLIQMNPPIRSVQDRDALWIGIQKKIIDIIGSDHAPHTLEEKQKQYPESPSGIPGVQTTIGIMLNHINAGRLTLERFVELTSATPSRIFNISRKGQIKKGYDADLTIIDMNKIQTIQNSTIASKTKWTPYDGMIVKGSPIGTIIRGHTVMWEGEIIHPAQGEAVKFKETNF
ncbi:MAG: dihydroorotase [Candidatus Tokpelaia sp. JSC161]|jgi:dihydroorotase|nr:MAG: dihydroorotase [Candidatus Tokpelaia sp. JSC161]